MSELPGRIGAALDAIEELHTRYIGLAGVAQRNDDHFSARKWTHRAEGLRDASHEITTRILTEELSELFRSAGDNQ